MKANNDLQHLKSTNKLTLALNNSLRGYRGPIAIKRALADHPELFMTLLREMEKAVRGAESQSKQMELKL